MPSRLLWSGNGKKVKSNGFTFQYHVTALYCMEYLCSIDMTNKIILGKELIYSKTYFKLP